MATTRQAKRRGALLIALADLSGLWSLMETTKAISSLAEHTLDLCINHLLDAEIHQGSFAGLSRDTPSAGSGLVVLGMGKFGAFELNYSSDIDLIVFYDDHTAPCVDPDQMGTVFVRLTRELVRLMDERTGDGYVFRTDLRLRPDPGATPLAVSISAAEAYYASVGQNWERAAMIKARPVAGDRAAGRRFLKMLTPWIWRKNLDFAAIQDIQSIKRQINAKRGIRTRSLNGHNVKLGHGGIREIEFFAQTQQLIYGGRMRQLRTPATLDALDALTATGHVTADVRDDLRASYVFLRTLEHRLQMVDDRQTHSLPKSDEGIAQIALFMGFDDAPSFRRALQDHLTRVENHYAALFADAPSLASPGNLVFTGTENDPGTLDTLACMGYQEPGGIIATIRTWHHGRYRATRTPRGREILTELVPSILCALADTPAPTNAFRRFDAFLENLPAGVELLSMFRAKPQLLQLVAEVMGAAPRIADHLARHPRLLDAVLTNGFFDSLPDRSALEQSLTNRLQDAQDFQDVLDITRRWAADKRFQSSVQILQGTAHADKTGPYMSTIAEIAVAAIQHAVEQEFADRHGTIDEGDLAILAYGKLGSREMSPGTDLDIVLIYDCAPGPIQSNGPKPLTPPVYFARVAQRLISAITVLTGEGRLYDVDTRLRPFGDQGALAISIDGFARYQAEDAWTWEHMALTRARVVTGGAALRQRITDVVSQTLQTRRDPNVLTVDVARMRARIERTHAATRVWQVKHHRGGMVDIEFMTQLLLLHHAPDHPEILSSGTMNALGRLCQYGLISAEDEALLSDAYCRWLRLQGLIRLTIDGQFNPETAPPGLRMRLCKAAFPDLDKPIDFNVLETKLAECYASVAARYHDLITQRAAAHDPVTSPNKR